MSQPPAPAPIRLELDRGFARGLVTALLVGAVLALVNAFGMAGAPLMLRLAYWETLMTIGAVWGHLCSLRVERRIDFDRRPWLAAAALTAVISGPLAVAVWALTAVFFFRPPTPQWADLPFYLGPVVLVTGVVSVLNVFLGRQAVRTHAPPPDAAPRPVRFLDRLPPRLRGARIHAVEAEDHYLRIHTDRGSDLILMRLSDAVAELDGLEGAQTHRSWWVARDAVRGATRGDGRAVLDLDGGVQALVSRRYASSLRQAGWY